MGLHKGAPKMKFGSWYYPKGDERREPVPVTEYERVAKPEPITGKDLAEYREAYVEHAFREIEAMLVRARHKVHKVILADPHAGVLANYMKAYGEIIRALEFEPDPFTTSHSPALDAVMWDLKGIRVAMEALKPVNTIDRLIGDLLDVVRTDDE